MRYPRGRSSANTVTLSTLGVQVELSAVEQNRGHADTPSGLPHLRRSTTHSTPSIVVDHSTSSAHPRIVTRTFGVVAAHACERCDMASRLGRIRLSRPKALSSPCPRFARCKRCRAFAVSSCGCVATHKSAALQPAGGCNGPLHAAALMCGCVELCVCRRLRWSPRFALAAPYAPDPVEYP
jgi:hypothetical protein